MLYVGSYFALVLPEPRAGYYCHYRVADETLLPTFFWPLEQVDRMVRPGAWGGEIVRLKKQGGGLMVPEGRPQ